MNMSLTKMNKMQIKETVSAAMIRPITINSTKFYSINLSDRNRLSSFS